MGNKTLQALSLQYARGEIAKPEYRQKRAIIINQTTGIVAPDSTEPVQSIENSTAVPLRTESTLFLKAGVISAVVIATLILAYVAL